MRSRCTGRSISALRFVALIGFATGLMLSKMGGTMEALAGEARLKTLTCSGELWNVPTDPAGTSWLEIGHGVHQCSIKNALSENAKTILSVCNMNAPCSMEVKIDDKRLQKSAADGECDDVCVFETDKITWVKKGNAKK
jgi:hypothetical protein